MALVYEYARHGSVEKVLLVDKQFALHLQQQPLSAQQQREQAESFCRCARWGMEMCAGLAHLHKARIIHRDFALRNLLFDESYRIKLTDFGISKSVKRSQYAAASQFANAAAVNSPHARLQYRSIDAPFALREAAPEMFNGDSSVQSDMYMLGLALYSLFSRKQPFHDLADDGKVGEFVREGKLSLVSGQYLAEMKSAGGSLSSEWGKVAELVEWCTKHDKDQRPSLTQVRCCFRLRLLFSSYFSFFWLL